MSGGERVLHGMTTLFLYICQQVVVQDLYNVQSVTSSKRDGVALSDAVRRCQTLSTLAIAAAAAAVAMLLRMFVVGLRLWRRWLSNT